MLDWGVQLDVGLGCAIGCWASLRSAQPTHKYTLGVGWAEQSEAQHPHNTLNTNIYIVCLVVPPVVPFAVAPAVVTVNFAPSVAVIQSVAVVEPPCRKYAIC